MNVVLAARLLQVLIALARCAVWPVPQTPSRSNQCPQTEVDFDENRIAVVTAVSPIISSLRSSDTVGRSVPNGVHISQTLLRYWYCQAGLLRTVRV